MAAAKTLTIVDRWEVGGAGSVGEWRREHAKKEDDAQDQKKKKKKSGMVI